MRFYEAERIAAVRDRILLHMSMLTGVGLREVDESTSLVNDLGMDSLDTVELVMELEEEFDFNISDEEADRIRTVADAIEWIERHRGS